MINLLSADRRKSKNATTCNITFSTQTLLIKYY